MEGKSFPAGDKLRVEGVIDPLISDTEPFTGGISYNDRSCYAYICVYKHVIVCIFCAHTHTHACVCVCVHCSMCASLCAMCVLCFCVCMHVHVFVHIYPTC